MKTLLLHIGTYKTGTTSIQYSLYKNGPALLRYGINYLGHSDGCVHLTGRQVFQNSMKRKQLEHYLASEKGSIHIYSNECLWDLQSAQQNFLPAIINSGIYEKVFVISYVRKQSSFIDSFYKQEQKFGSPWAVGLSPLEFYSLVKSRGTLNINDRLGYYSNLFGRENILVKNFSAESLFQGDVVDDFYKYHFFKGIEVEASPIKNQSISSKEAVFRSIVFKFLASSDLIESKNINRRKGVDKFVEENFTQFESLISDTIYSEEFKIQIDSEFMNENALVENMYDIKIT